MWKAACTSSVRSVTVSSGQRARGFLLVGLVMLSMHSNAQLNSCQSWWVVKENKLLTKMLLLLVDHLATLGYHLFSFVSSGSVRRILLYLSQLQCNRSVIHGLKKTAAYSDLTWNWSDVKYYVIRDSMMFFSSSFQSTYRILAEFLT